MDKEFKILTIDGGGIKGLYSANVLKHLEERYSGCHLADHFDLICGTSTGGLIALALSIRRKASEIADFYAKNGEKIFPYVSRFARTYGLFKQSLWFGKYSDKVLKRSLEEFLGAETRMRDAQTLLCIPSFNLTIGEPIVFKKPHGNYFRDGNLKMIDVALATSAAPTYFPLSEINYPELKGIFIDGGVWANNPTLCGVHEALEHFVGEGKEFSSYSILSIASISQSNGWKIKESRHKSFWGWKGKLFETPLDGQNFFADHFTKTVVNATNPPGKYFRIPSPHQLSKEHLEDIEMDKAGKNSIKLLESLGNKQGIDYTTKPEHKSLIDAFFKEKKHYIL